jgi:predicted Zn-dependent protease
VLFRRGDAEEARAILESLLAAGCDEPHVHLFLADLLQYRLDDPAGAASQLEKYLRSRCDPDVERRLAELRPEAGS